MGPEEKPGPSGSPELRVDLDPGPSTSGWSIRASPAERTGPSCAASCSVTPKAENKGVQRPQGFVCPLCLDVFTKPTLLRCGHTFCRACLQKYDEENRGQDFMECPVCRKRTRFHGTHENRVNSLSPNYSVKGLEDELLGRGVFSAKFCPLHEHNFMDILCVDCDSFICVNCLLEKHQGHTIKKKEKLEAELRERSNDLVQKSCTKKTTIRKSISMAEQHYEEVRLYFDKMEHQLNDCYTEKLRILSENEEQLRSPMINARKTLQQSIKGYITGLRAIVSNIDTSLTSITSDKTLKYLDSTTLHSHHTQYANLEALLRMDVDTSAKTMGWKKTAQDMAFVPASAKELGLGSIHVSGGSKDEGASSSTGKMNSGLKVVPTANQRPESGTAKRTEGHCNRIEVRLPSALSNNTIHVLQYVEASHCVHGITAEGPSTVIVGYGHRRNGADFIMTTGERRQAFASDHVYDLVNLRNSASIIVRGISDNVLRIPGQEDIALSIPNMGTTFRMCRDQNYVVYGVNTTPLIYVYRGHNPLPYVIRIGTARPKQICVNKTGEVLVTTSRTIGVSNEVMVHDKHGRRGSYVEAQRRDDTWEIPYATIDSRDRVLIAMVRDDKNTFRLDRYTLEGTRLIREMEFREILLPRRVKLNDQCSMVSLTPTLIAFANVKHLYFIELSC